MTTNLKRAVRMKFIRVESKDKPDSHELAE